MLLLKTFIIVLTFKMLLSNLPLQNLAFQGGDVVAAKTSIVEKTLTFVKQCGILKYLLVKRSNFGYLLPLLLTSL